MVEQNNLGGVKVRGVRDQVTITKMELGPSDLAVSTGFHRPIVIYFEVLGTSEAFKPPY